MWIGGVSGYKGLRLGRDRGEETFLVKPDTVTAPAIC